MVIGSITGSLVAVVLVMAIVAFAWSQVSVMRSRRYPREWPKPEPEQTTTDESKP